jgi:hypothetical protein
MEQLQYMPCAKLVHLWTMITSERIQQQCEQLGQLIVAGLRAGSSGLNLSLWEAMLHALTAA